jgi:hypothetical protein
MTDRLSTLVALSERVKAATGPDDELAAHIICAAIAPQGSYVEQSRFNGAWCIYVKGGKLFDRPKELRANFDVTASIDAAAALLRLTLPGWWWNVGTCHLSDDATIGPDYNSPEHGERLRRELTPPAPRTFEEHDGRLSYGPFDGSFDIDRLPAGNLPLALLEVMLDALIYIEEMRLKSEAE